VLGCVCMFVPLRMCVWMCFIPTHLCLFIRLSYCLLMLALLCLYMYLCPSFRLFILYPV
jgi:hypothetical protein